MRKFGRNYSLTVGTRTGGVLTIQPPFTVEFDINRDILSGLNHAQIRIYNLGESSRNLIRKNDVDFSDLRQAHFKAGYGNNLAQIFGGSMTTCFSVREGVNMITTIEAFDGGFAVNNSTTDTAFPGPPVVTSNAAVLAGIMGDLSGIAVGAIGSFPGSLPRGASYSGQTYSILCGLAPGCIFIDNETINALGYYECFPGQVSTLSAGSGLLGTPEFQENIIRVEMLFEPGLLIGQQLTIAAQTRTDLNGTYKIQAIKHRGMISPAVCGEAVTSIQMLSSSALSLIGSAA